MIRLGKKLGQQKREKGGAKKNTLVGNPSPNCIRYGCVLVTFIIRLRCYRYVAIECVFLGCLPPPRETCPGRRPQAPACFKCIQFKIIYIYNIYIYGSPRAYLGRGGNVSLPSVALNTLKDMLRKHCKFQCLMHTLLVLF